MHRTPNPVLTQRLELHLVWPVGGAKTEAGGEVVNEVSLLLNVGQKGLVDGLLVLNAVLSGLLLLWHLLAVVRIERLGRCVPRASRPA